MEVTSIKIELIDEDLDQPRYQFSEEKLEELANSIRELGLLSPIKVRDMKNGRYKIIYGNRRYKASVMIGLENIPCIISTAENDTDIYLEQIAENLTREDFSPIEEAEAFHKLMNDDLFRSSTKLIASKLGKTESYIKNKLELLKFSNAVKKLIVSGTQIRKDCLTEDQLIPLKDLPIEYRDSLALTAARDELPVSDVKKIAKLFKDSSISDNTKQKLLLKNGSGLIETWSVFEQNRKEKLAREKEAKEKQAEKLEQAKQKKQDKHSEDKLTHEQLKTNSQVINDTAHKEINDAAVLSQAPLAGTKPSAIANNNLTATDQASTLAITTTSAELSKLPYIEQIDKALEQAELLLQSLQNGSILDFEASQQLAVDMLIKVKGLQQVWQDIERASQANSL